MSNSDGKSNTRIQTHRRKWIIAGLLFGLIMFVIMELGIASLEEEGIDHSKLILKGVVWLVAGLIWGVVMMFIQRPTNK